MLSKSEAGPFCHLKGIFTMKVTESLECFCLTFLFKIKVFVLPDLRGTL